MKKLNRVLLIAALTVAAFFVTLFAASCSKKPEYNVTFMNGEEIVATVTGHEGDVLEAPAAPQEEGYSFTGWSLGGTGEIKEFPTTIPGEDVTYHANYAKLYAIELNVGSGTLGTQKVYASAGSNLYDALKDVVPTTSDDTYFGAWFYGNKEITSESNTIMPRKDITVRARYKVDYTIQLYKQTEFNVDGYDKDPIVQNGSDYVETKVKPTVVYPEDYEYVSETGEQTELQLSNEKEKNVYIYYCRIIGVNLEFNANEPADTEVAGEMESLYLRKGTETKIAECGYTIQGYRFAGWATKVDGDVAYKPGESFDGQQNLFLYAVWDKGYTDMRGGVDYVYIDHFDKQLAYLERTGISEKLGSYDEDTRIFSFEKNASSKLRGRLALDGEKFYYLDDVEGTYGVYDAYNYEAKSESIKINSYKDAVYTNAEGTSVNGTYTLGKEGDYEFTSESGTAFSFQLTTVDKEGTVGCFIKGSEAGMFFMLDGNSISPLFVLSLDGYGGISIILNLSTSYSGVYQLSQLVEDEIYAAVYMNGEYQALIFRTYIIEGKSIFLTSDGLQNSLEYTYTDEVSGAEKTDVLFIDGYGTATYTPDGGEPQEGSYTVLDSSTYSLQFTPKEGDGFKFTFDSKGKTYQPIEKQCGRYQFMSGGYIYYVLLQVKYDHTATIYVPNADGKTWTPMVNGTYVSVSNPENSFIFTADEDGWVIENEAYRKKYSEFTFRVGVTNNYYIFEIYNAEMEGKILTPGDSNYTFTGYNSVVCNIQSNRYEGSYRIYTPEDGNTFFNYIEILLSNKVTIMLVDISKDSTPVYKEYLGNSYENSYNNPGKYSARIYPLSDNYMAVAIYDEASSMYKFTLLGTFINQDKDENSDADNYFLFNYTAAAPDTEAEILNEFGEFRCQLWTLSGTRIFLQYDENRVHTASGSDGSSMEFTAYGLVNYKASQTAEPVQGRYLQRGALFAFTSFETGKSILFHFTNEEETTYAPAGEKEGEYYFFDGSQPYTDSTLVLAGVSATLISKDGEIDGQYVYDEETEDYLFTADGYEMRFRLTQVTNTQTQQTYPVYYVSNPDIILNLSVVDKDDNEIGTIKCDGYGTCTYYDRGEDITYTAKISTNDKKTAFSVRTYSAAGTLLTTRYYEIKNEAEPGIVWEYGFEKNTYIGYDNGNYLEYVITLDGHGVAKKYNLNNTLLESGTYEINEEGMLLYTAAGQTKAKEYKLFASGSSSATIYFCTEIDENEGIYYADDWSVLILDGYEVNATYIDGKGIRYTGGYTILKDGYVKFSSSKLSAPLIVTLNKETGKYALATEQYIAEGGKLLAWVDYTATTVTLPENISEIGEGAFEGMTSLVSITMPNVTSIGTGAFYYCTSLKTVVANKLVSIGSRAFYYCSALTDINGEKIESIGIQSFYGCTSLTELTLTSVKTIGAQAFLHARTLRSITIGSAIEEIGDNAFAYVNADGKEDTVVTVTFLGTGVPTFGEEIFAGVPLTELEIVVVDEATKAAFAAKLEAYAEAIVVAAKIAA